MAFRKKTTDMINDTTSATPAFKERRAALEAEHRALDEARERKILAAKQAIEDARAHAEAGHAAADRREEETATRLDRETAEALAAELAPHVEAFKSNGDRSSASAIAETYRRHAASLIESTGEVLSPLTLGFAVVRAHGVPTPSLPFFQGDAAGCVVHAAARVADLATGGAAGLELAPSLAALEGAVLAHGRQHAAGNAEDYAAASACASHRRIAAVVGSFSARKREREVASRPATVAASASRSERGADAFDPYDGLAPFAG